MNEFLKTRYYEKIQIKNKANKTKPTIGYVVGLNRLAKFKYFNSQDCKKHTKPFWDKCRTYFCNKHSRGGTNIILKEKTNS